MKPVAASTITAPTQRAIRGFTTVELLVTVAILAIFAGIALPSYKQIIARQRVRAASSDLYMQLIQARSEAIKRNQNVSIIPTSTHWEDGWKVPDPAATSYNINVHGSMRAVTIRAQNQVSDPATVVYQNSGRLKVAAGAAAPYFIVTSTSVPATQYCVSVDLSGRPYSARGSTC